MPSSFLQVRLVAEDEMFKVVWTGKRKTKQWKRMVTKATFIGPGFTRKPPKYERFIRPTDLRFTKAHVTHPELKCTFNLEIIGVKKNPNDPMYTSLGVMTKGTITELRWSRTEELWQPHFNTVSEESELNKMKDNDVSVIANVAIQKHLRQIQCIC
ncbi:ribosome biogenesis protein NSA2 [Vigna unguiculata]|uniref:Ribosome biogenesis protein NSA2 n=1 Tax=Vigna unguiculata TaxID=3917 RepID=A0A4D6LID0_VIGUN|nr:ribosome biogenesis protein NSA2 [Vigna unguiculata]